MEDNNQSILELRMYLVRNNSGSYYKRVGYGGYGSCWTDDIKKASVWTKISVARSRVTFFANKYPEYPIPDLIEVCPGEINVLKETERVQKCVAKKIKEEAAYKAYMHSKTCICPKCGRKT